MLMIKKYSVCMTTQENRMKCVWHSHISCLSFNSSFFFLYSKQIQTRQYMENNEKSTLILITVSHVHTHLTHRTKSPTIVVESRTKKTPPSRSFINRSVASCRDIGPKYQLKCQKRSQWDIGNTRNTGSCCIIFAYPIICIFNLDGTHKLANNHNTTTLKRLYLFLSVTSKLPAIFALVFLL